MKTDKSDIIIKIIKKMMNVKEKKKEGKRTDCLVEENDFENIFCLKKFNFLIQKEVTVGGKK